MPPLDARPFQSKYVATIVGAPIMLKEFPALALLSLGIIGGALTLFSNLLAPLDMADWAWWIVGHWQEATPAFWDRLAAWTGLEVPSLLVPPLNMAAFLLLTSIGVRIRDDRSEEDVAVLNIPFYHLIGGSAVLLAIGYVIVAGPPQSTSAGDVPVHAPLVIFLAGAAASFSPMLAGGGNLIKRLWFILAGVAVLVALNELTKLGLDMVTPTQPS